MTSYMTPKKNSAYVFFTALESQAAAGTFKSSPTLAAGDFKVSIDGGALANLATLPTNTPGGVMVKISLSTSEMNGDNITVVCIDAAGAEWYDQLINIQTSARQIDDLAFPTTSGRSIDVAATGEVGLDFDNRKDTNSILPSETAGSLGGLPVLDINSLLPANVVRWDSNLIAGTLPALQGADGDTLETLSDQIDGIGSGGLTAQETRDALKLAPTAGAAAAGSIDDLLADILEDTGTTLPGLMAAELSNTSDSTASGAITRTRGNSWTINATIGAITGYTSLWFTVKHSQDDADSDAILQIKLNSTGSDDDLLYVNGATASDSTFGTITVSDASTGAVIIAVDETVTDDMPAGAFYYDVQVLNSGAVTTPDSGTFTITADVTRSIA